MRNASAISVFAMKHPCPRALICAIALSIVWYWTVHNSCGMLSLMLDPVGWERWCISLYEPCCFFGTTPRGEMCKFGKGGDAKGPAMRCSVSSFLILLSIFWSWRHRGRAHALSGQCKLIYKFGAIGLAHYSSMPQAMPSWEMTSTRSSTILWHWPNNLQEPQFPHRGSYYSSTAGDVRQPD